MSNQNSKKKRKKQNKAKKQTNIGRKKKTYLLNQRGKKHCLTTHLSNMWLAFHNGQSNNRSNPPKALNFEYIDRPTRPQH